MKRFFILNSLFIFLVTLAFCGTSIAEASDSNWKAGRAKIEASGDVLTLRLSLRNEGKAGRDSLVILGRWKDSGSKYKSLGDFTKEVALKQTAILMIPLKSLGSASSPLEITLKTGTQETDHKTIPLP